ncbi:MAG: hypothetical protein KJ795_06460 [Gammaproteobacteria bacterium]|nr:hypothetical protein [Gammaproteobacteria bacterium]MBU1969624.1 hypothetical protein [Gammaproteobacteria bacterium]
MPVSPANLASNYVSQVQPQPQPQPERAAEQARVEAAKQQQEQPRPAPAEAALRPTVNSEGQAVGNVINEKA